MFKHNIFSTKIFSGSLFARDVGEDTEVIAVPSGFGFDWTPLFTITRNGSVFSATINPESFKVSASKDVYVNFTSGNNSNDGLTLGNAKKTWTGVLAIVDEPCNIYITAGVTPAIVSRNMGFSGNQSLPFDCNIISLDEGGTWLTTFEDGLTATKVGGYTNIYKVTTTNSYSVVDLSNLDANGVAVPTYLVADLATCDATAGSHFISGNDLNFHLFDSRVPDADCKYNRNAATAGLRINDGDNIYVENIVFAGANRPINSQGTITTATNVFFNNCQTRYSCGNRGTYIKGNITSYLYEHQSHYNFEDNIDYDGGATGIEYNVLSTFAGFQNGSANNFNASTCHNGATALRINTRGENYKGPGIIETNTNTQSLNLGCTADTSLHTTEDDTANAGFVSQNAAEMWVYYCTTIDNTYDLVEVDTAVLTDLGGGVYGAGQNSGTITQG